MNFEITKEEHEKINLWLETEVYPEVIARQKETYKDNLFIMSTLEQGQPYGGAIGGGLSYTFTPNSLGLGFRVKEWWSGKELNLTDYDSW